MSSEVQKFPNLDKLSTPELEKLLRDDERGKIALCISDIQKISEILLFRERQNPTLKLPDPQEALKKIKVANKPSEQDTIDQGDVTGAVTCGLGRKIHKHLVRNMVATIAAGAAIISIVIMPALGYEGLLQILGRWTAEQFFFVTSENEVDVGELDSPHEPGVYASIQDALEDYDITADIVPSWLPDRFSIEEVEVDIDIPIDGDISFFVSYTAEDNVLNFSYIFHATGSSSTYEKDDADVQFYMVNGITHYIFSDQDWVSAAWYVDDLECSISGNITIGEMKTIIDSIYGGE